MIRIALKSSFGNSFIYLKEDPGQIYTFGDKKLSMKFTSIDEAKSFVEKLVIEKQMKKNTVGHLEYTEE